MARIVSEMNQPASDPTTLIRPQSTPDSSTVSEQEDEDADMLGELWENHTSLSVGYKKQHQGSNV